jgi:acetate kinase
MTILAINAGSSSLKFALYPLHTVGGGVAGVAGSATLSGSIEGLQPGGQPRLGWRDSTAEGGEALLPPAAAEPFSVALEALQTLLQAKLAGASLQAVAHRVVHGGELYCQPVRVDAAVLAQLDSLSPLAPLHQPHNLHGIRAFSQHYPNLPHVACFDTAFHAALAQEEYRFALPERLRAQGVRRYGFHGLSYQYVSQRLQILSPLARGKVVMAHLGNGASLCAMQDGQSRATTMGFSALDGLIMGTRCGALDPGVLLHLLTQGWQPQDLQDLLYRQSGLLGVSGISADMRTLQQSHEPAAKLAIRMFVQRLVRECGAMAATIGGMEVLAFTGGIGEHDAQIRLDTCQRLAFLGVQLDPGLNARANGVAAMAVHAPESRVEIWVIPTDEGLVAAQAAADYLSSNIPPGN